MGICHCSEGSLLRRFITPNRVEGSLLRIEHKDNCSEGSLLRRVIASMGHCSIVRISIRVRVRINRVRVRNDHPHAYIEAMNLWNNDHSNRNNDHSE